MGKDQRGVFVRVALVILISGTHGVSVHVSFKELTHRIMPECMRAERGGEGGFW